MQNIIHSIYFSNEISKTPPHHHDCHQLILILKGEVEMCVNDKKNKAVAGTVTIFSRYENHSVKILSNEYERYVLRINPQIHSEHNKIFALLSNRPAGFNNTINVSSIFSEVKRLFESILSELNSSHILSEEMLLSLINQLLIMIYRSSSDNDDYFDEQRFKTILKIQKELENNCSLNYSLDELAKKYNLSVSSLSHQFKKITGMSVMNYLLSCRIACAKNYLLKSNLSINEIVESCGFNDSSNFSRTFKKLNGVTPTQFRNSNKK